MSSKRLIYTGGKFPVPHINPVCYNPEFFQIEIDLESDLFCEQRSKSGMEPACLGDSTPEELVEIGGFFLKHKDCFYFLFHENGELIGCILHSFGISAKYQRQGYGGELMQYCINRILDTGYGSVELKVLDGNIEAERLYRRIGFEDKK